MAALQAHWGKARPGQTWLQYHLCTGVCSEELKSPQGCPSGAELHSAVKKACVCVCVCVCVCIHAHLKKKRERERNQKLKTKLRRSHITPKLFLGVLLLLFYESESLSCGLGFPVTGPWAAEPVTQGTWFPAHQDSLPGPWKHPRVLPRNPCTDWRLTDMHWSLQAYIVRATEKNWVPRGEHPVWPGGKT